LTKNDCKAANCFSSWRSARSAIGAAWGCRQIKMDAGIWAKSKILHPKEHLISYCYDCLQLADLIFNNLICHIKASTLILYFNCYLQFPFSITSSTVGAGNAATSSSKNYLGKLVRLGQVCFALSEIKAKLRRNLI